MSERANTLATVVVFTALAAPAGAQTAGTAFTYQGELIHNGVAVDESCDFSFSLFDEAIGGHALRKPVVRNGVPVAGGVFSVVLDFGEGVFDGQLRWLQVSVTCPSIGPTPTLLAPRQEIRPVPYALALPAMRIEQESTGLADPLCPAGLVAPNVIGGWHGNAALGDPIGATIAGGGAGCTSSVKIRIPNTVAGSFSSIGGGRGNTAAGFVAAIGGGDGNSAEGSGATIAGGEMNTASDGHATIGGGAMNTASGQDSTVGGGQQNTAGAIGATVGGGRGNSAAHQDTTVGGGGNNSATNQGATVAGGNGNMASGANGTVSGGANNTAGFLATVGGGQMNEALGGVSTVPGGLSNVAGGDLSFAAGSRAKVRTRDQVIADQGSDDVFAGDQGTFVWADTSSTGDFVSTGPNQFLIRAAGGVGIGTNSPGRALQIGDLSVPDSEGMIRLASLSGTGVAHRIWDVGVPETDEDLSGNGYHFVIDDTQLPGPIAEFLLEWGTGHLGLGGVVPSHPIEVGDAGSGVNDGNGAHLTDVGMWTNASDANLKTDFVATDAGDILRRLVVLPVRIWRYKGEDDGVRHIGPTAQDFWAAFGLGQSETHIGTADADGVALAAIQGLHELLCEKEAEIDAQRAENEAQAKKIADLTVRLSRLESLVIKSTDSAAGED